MAPRPDDRLTPPEAAVRTAGARAEIQQRAERAASEGAARPKNPRDQYIFAEKAPDDETLARSWSMTARAIAAARTQDAAHGLEWVDMRAEYWRRVSSLVADLLERETKTELEDTVGQYRATVAGLMKRLTDVRLAKRLNRMMRSKDEEALPRYLKSLDAMASTVKKLVEIEEKLTGAKFAQKIFDAEMENYEWFGDLIRAYVRDPNAIEAIAKAIQTRRVTRTLVATGEYEDAIAYARRPDVSSVQRALAAVERKVVDVPSRGTEVAPEDDL